MNATDFPHDLVQTQATALRRRLLRLSVRLWWHPYWETAPSAPAARAQLRQLIRVRGAVRAA